MTKVKLGDFVSLQAHKVENAKAVKTSYVSTENLQPNKGGVLFPAASVPSSGKVNSYVIGDILVSNIRPYFKKIWMATNPGTHSGDVLNFRTKSPKLTQEYLYTVLESDAFFDYVTLTSKGTKMPRGDKDAIVDFEFSLPSLDVQQKISNTIMALESKIFMSKQVNDNLFELGQILFNGLNFKGDSKEMAVYDISKVRYGFAYKSKQFNEAGDGLPVIRIRDLKTGNPRYSTVETDTKEVPVATGDLLVGMDAEFTPTIWAGKEARLNQRVLKMEPLDEISPLFLYYLIKPKMAFYENSKAGTTVIHLGKKDMDEIRFEGLSKDAAIQLSKQLAPIHAQLIVNFEQIRSLNELRDTLLKQLIN